MRGEAAVRGKYKDVGTAAVAVLIGYLGRSLRGECGSMWWSVSVCDGKAGEGIKRNLSSGVFCTTGAFQQVKYLTTEEERGR